MYYNTHTHTHTHQLESPSTKEIESCSFKQLADQVYDDASSTQPDLKNNMYVRT